MPLLRSVSALVLAGSLALVGNLTHAQEAASPQAQPFTDAQRAGIEAIIKDYLVKNPEVLQEAIAEGEKRAQETQRLAQTAALKESR
ncbi:hypothetical protein NL336_26870, partial [Klebsiella pneumoniae]|nr:hypothetical protein [Klebsiella pneumoniae]